MSSLTAARSASRTIHRDALMRALRERGACSRADLQTATGLSRSTVSAIVSELFDEGQIERSPVARMGQGRPVELIRIPAAVDQRWLGVEFSHGRVYAAVVSGRDTLVSQATCHYDMRTSWTARFTLAMQMLDEELPEIDRIAGIGIGFPSSAVMRGDDLISRGQDGALELVSKVAANLSQRYGAKVSVDNNVRLAALAEMLWRTDRQSGNQLYLRIADGIGGALVCGGHLVTGESGFGGEMGHVTVEPGGAVCRCGKRGCLETVASSRAVVRRCVAAGLDVADINGVAGAYREGHRIAVETVTQAIAALGSVLGTVSVLTDPARIVVAGTLPEAFPHLVEAVRDRVGLDLLPVNHMVPLTLRARLGDEAGALGAALMAMSTNEFPYPILTPAGTV